jgi:myxalamid-type polyketide synthase MxaE and MxaD
VRVASVDVAEEPQLSAFLSDVQAEGLPPIRGVVHCAGVAEAGALGEIDAEQLARLARPKVLGAWLLHRFLEHERLDFFVTFSSGAALLGSPLLGSYAAANAFLDAVAHHRRGQGNPALSVNWGFWSDVGMAARSQRELGQVFAPQGMQSFSPAQGLAALGHLLEHRAVQTAVMPVDWPEWCRFHPRASRSPLLTNLLRTETDLGETAEPLPAGATLSRSEVMAAPQRSRRQLLQDYLTRQLSRVLRTPPGDLDVELPLNYLGIDSLMAVELRNHIQADLDVTVPVAHLLQRPTIAQLVGVLLDQLEHSPDVPPIVPAMSDETSRDAPDAPGPSDELAVETLARLDELSDEEVSAMLGKMIEGQQRET